MPLPDLALVDFQFLVSLVTAAVVLLLGGFVLLSDRKQQDNLAFFFIAINTALWIVTVSLRFSVVEDTLATHYARATFGFASLIVISLYLFSVFFSEEHKRLSWFDTAFFFLGGLIALSSFSSVTVARVVIQEGTQVDTYGAGYLVFIVFFAVALILSSFNLWKKYRGGNKDLRRQIEYILIGFGLSLFFGFFSNVILPWATTITQTAKVGPVGSIFFVLFTSIAILKHKLFDLKVISTELVVFSLWIVVLARTLLSDSVNETWFNGLLLLTLIVVGILLIRSVRKEVSAREEIQALATDLKVANARLTDLDRQKSEFVSIASHQLRSPLTAIKGYVSMLLEGTPSYGNLAMGEIKADGVEALRRVFKSSNQLVLIIEDLLNVSRIEQGRMQYTMTSFDAGEMARELVENMAVNARERGLAITYQDDSTGPYTISGDEGKVRQVINNVIDNSVKYTPKGSIAVSVGRGIADGRGQMADGEKPENRQPFDKLRAGTATDNQQPVTGDKIQIRVKDTGIGIPPETMPKLFQKFSRAQDAGKVNVTGTGIGLFIAQEIMKAHGGKVWAESPGRNKGSTFVIELAPSRSLEQPEA